MHQASTWKSALLKVYQALSSYQHSHARSCNTKIHRTASAEVNDPGQIHKYSHIILDEALLRVSIYSGDTYPMFRVEGLKNEWNQGISAIIRIDQLLIRTRASCSNAHHVHNLAVRTVSYIATIFHRYWDSFHNKAQSACHWKHFRFVDSDQLPAILIDQVLSRHIQNGPLVNSWPNRAAQCFGSLQLGWS